MYLLLYSITTNNNNITSALRKDLSCRALGVPVTRVRVSELPVQRGMLRGVGLAAAPPHTAVARGRGSGGLRKSPSMFFFSHLNPKILPSLFFCQNFTSPHITMLHHHDLPSWTDFIDLLLDDLNSKCTSTSNNNETPRQSLSSLSTHQLSTIKPLLLTLHCIFPNELLVALDILDRKLVRLLRPTSSDESSSFFVISATNSSSSSSSSPSPDSSNNLYNAKGYQVCLHAWNCTCPGFVYSAFSQDEQGSNHCAPQDQEKCYYYCPFGGSLARDSSPPVCKHVLACLLAVRCPALFGVDHHHHVMDAKELAALCCAGHA